MQSAAAIFAAIFSISISPYTKSATSALISNTEV
jgi:hypothetical protein